MARLFLLGLVAALSACQTPPPAPASHRAPPLRPVRELRQDLVGQGMSQVLSTLGKPTEVYSVTGGETWYYENASRDSVTGRTVRYMEVVFQHRHVSSVDFAY